MSAPDSAETIEDLREELLQSRRDFREQWEATSTKRSIARALVRMRGDVGCSQTELAKRAGWDKAFVSRLEAASGPLPDTVTLIRYAVACGRALGLVFAQVNEHRTRVIDAVTLSAPGALRSLESLRGEELALQGSVPLKAEG